VILETGRKDLHLILESTSAYDWQIPACKGEAEKQQFGDLPIRVSIPPALHSEQLSSESDSPFIIHRSAGYPPVRLSKGNSGAPFGRAASWMFGSDEFTQRNVLNAEGKPIGTDTEGSQEKKRFWRIVALPGQEIMEYYGVTRETADVFNGIFDSACMQTH
jgi:hypothetical protein